MKRTISLVLCTMFVILCLTACGGGGGSSVGSSTVGSMGAAPAAAEESYYDYEDDYDGYGSDGVNGANGTTDATGYAGTNGIDGDKSVDGDFDSVNSNVTFDEDRKLIYHADVTLETLHYAETYNELVAIINKYKGYIQSENYSNDSNSYLRADDEVRYGLNVYGQNDICIRIPREHYADFMEDGLALGNVIGRSQTVDDQTANYATNESYIDILNKKVEYYDSQLQKLESELDEAMKDDDTAKFEQILRDMQYMSNQKADVENELIPYKRHNDQIDAESSYATINMSIREVKEYTKPEIDTEPEKEPTFGERIAESFEKSWTRFVKWFENLVIFLIEILPVILILAVPTLIVLFIILMVRCIRKSKKKRQLVKDVQNEIATNFDDDPIIPQDFSVD